MKRDKGLSVIIRNKNQYDRLKDLLGQEVLYIDWTEAMIKNETAIMIWYKGKYDFETGSIGRAEYHRDFEIKTVEFEEYFKL